jgi:PAS domain S-box-containing protein
MPKTLAVLIVEDSESDAQLIVRLLAKAGYSLTFERVDSPAQMRAALEAQAWEIVISDFSMPGMDGFTALKVLHETGQDIPFIVVSGAIGEVTAVDMMKAGAHDYVMKGNLARLVPAVERELSQAGVRLERKRADETLRESEAKYRRLFEDAAIGVFHSSFAGRFLDVNPALARMLGYDSPQEVIDSIYSISEQIYVDPPQRSQIMEDALAKGEAVVAENRYRRKDGTQWTGSLILRYVLDAHGQPQFLEGFVEDITERKQSESALRLYALRQEKIAGLGRALAAEIDLAVIYRTARDHIQPMIDCPNFRITLFDSQQGILHAAYVSSDGVQMDVSHIPPLTFDFQHSSSGRSKAIASKSPEIVLDMAAERKAAGGLLVGSELEPQSAIYVPMLAEGQVIGLMELQSYQREVYSSADSEWLSVVANLIGMSIQNARLFARAQQRIAELSAMAIIDSALTSHLAPQEMFEILLEQVIKQLGVDAAVLFLFNPQSQVLECVCQRGYTHTSNLQIRLRLGESLAGQAVLEKSTFHINHLSSENAHLLKNVSRSEGFEEYYGVPLLVENKIIGVLELLHRSQLNPDSDWLRFLEMLAGQSAIVISTLQLYQDVQQGNMELLKAYDATIEGWSQAMDLRDKETENHTRRVTELTLQLGQHFGLTADQLMHLRRGALLHDIGKLGVPDHILLKTDPLTSEEWVIMKSHPQLAYDMLAKIEYLRPALDIPYGHHEKWDGSGYPRGLKAEQIPFAARLFAVVDVYDALTNDRPYRRRWSQEKTIQLIQAESGKHFDPIVVEAFLNIVNEELGR